MSDLITKVITWIKSNLILAVLIAVAIVIVIFGKGFKRSLFGTRRVKHRAGYYAVRTRSGRRLPHSAGRRRLPRSVGIRRRNKPAVYNKSGTRKKPWQIKGSIAARRHMAQIRRMR